MECTPEKIAPTSVVVNVWKAPACTDAPDPAAFGEELTLGSPWVKNDWTYSEDDFDIELSDADDIEIRPIGYPIPVAKVSEQAGIKQVTIPSYEIGSRLYSWATNAIVDGSTYTETTHHTGRIALLLEVKGVGFFYFPTCECKLVLRNMGRQTLTQQSLVFSVYATDKLKSGYAWVEYEDSEYGA